MFFGLGVSQDGVSTCAHPWVGNELTVCSQTKSGVAENAVGWFGCGSLLASLATTAWQGWRTSTAALTVPKPFVKHLTGLVASWRFRRPTCLVTIQCGKSQWLRMALSTPKIGKVGIKLGICICDVFVWVVDSTHNCELAVTLWKLAGSTCDTNWQTKFIVFGIKLWWFWG